MKQLLKLKPLFDYDYRKWIPAPFRWDVLAFLYMITGLSITGYLIVNGQFSPAFVIFSFVVVPWGLLASRTTIIYHLENQVLDCGAAGKMFDEQIKEFVPVDRLKIAHREVVQFLKTDSREALEKKRFENE